MIWKPTALVSAALLLVMLASPASAASHVVAQKTTTTKRTTVILRRGLTLNHAYRVHLDAGSKVKFGGVAMQYYTYVTKGLLQSKTRVVTLKGSTSRSYSFSPPISHITGWTLEVQVQDLGRKPLNVQIIDMGKAK